MVDQNNGIVGSTTGSNYYVRILSTINREHLKPSASVAFHRHSNALVNVLPPEANSSISLLSQSVALHRHTYSSIRPILANLLALSLCKSTSLRTLYGSRCLPSCQGKCSSYHLH